MNTIRLYLAPSGEIAYLEKDFPLYQYQYQSKLVEIYVPLSICLNGNDFVDGNNSTGTTVQLKMSATDTQGHLKTTMPFYARFIKKITTRGTDYALFSRLLPYAFTIYSGIGADAPEISVSVATIVDNIVTSIVSTQRATLEVNPSTQLLDGEPPMDASDYDELETQINNLWAKMGADTINPSLQSPEEDTNDHTASGNINTLIDDNKTNQENIGTLQEQMATAQDDIQKLYDMIGYGVNIVGEMTVQDVLPTDAQVTAKVVELTGNPPVRGQALIVRLDLTSGTDTIYLYVYDGENWAHFEMQFLNDANNGIKGLIAGNYTINGLQIADNFMVDISNGIIINIYRVDEYGNQIDFKSVADQVIAKLVGNTPVNRAIGDKNGRDITTYMPQGNGLDDGASHRYVQEYASPKALYDINYPDYADGELKHNKPTANEYNSDPISVAGAGETLIATLVKTLDADILLGDQNGLINRVWAILSATEGDKLRIKTYYVDGQGNDVELSNSLTDYLTFTTGNAVLATINSVFSGLTTPITLNAGTIIKQEIFLVRDEVTSISIRLLCNNTYDAYMTFDKIGYVRYALEQEPSSIEAGNNAVATTDLDNNLVVTGDGEMGFANGDSAPIATIIKIPMSNGVAVGDNLPVSGDKVAQAIADSISVLDISNWESPITDEQLALIMAEPKPTLLKGNKYYYYTHKNSLGGGHYNYVFNSKGVTSGEFMSLYFNSSTKEFVEGYIELAYLPDIIAEYSSSSTYRENDLVIIGGQIRRCKQDITTPEDFTSAHWQVIPNLAYQIADNTSDIDILYEDKLDKIENVTTYDQAYIKTASGHSNVRNIVKDSADANSIVQRDANGDVIVPSTPTANGGATSKDYVDTQDAKKLDKKTSGASYGLQIPNTSAYASDKTIATTDDVATKQDALSQTQLDAVNSGIDSTKVGKIATNESDIDAIEAKIPTQASSSNQLADKDFVNSSIATNTAVFRGTFNVVSDLGLTTSATQAQVATAIATKLSALGITPTNNDYVFVAFPNSAQTTIERYDRYKYNGTSWAYEFSLNNSSFTSAQWDAINSGITSALVGQIGTNQSNISSHVGNTSNPHGVTKSQVGLGHVDDTSDADKPVSTAQQTALDGKLDKQTGTTTENQLYGKYANGTQTMFSLYSAVVNNGVVRRDGNGQIKVPTTPSANDDSASKSYVDSAIANAITTALNTPV